MWWWWLKRVWLIYYHNFFNEWYIDPQNVIVWPAKCDVWPAKCDSCVWKRLTMLGFKAWKIYKMSYLKWKETPPRAEAGRFIRKKWITMSKMVTLDLILWSWVLSDEGLAVAGEKIGKNGYWRGGIIFTKTKKLTFPGRAPIKCVCRGSCHQDMDQAGDRRMEE